MLLQWDRGILLTFAGKAAVSTERPIMAKRYYGKMDPARKLEREDFGMINSDYNAVANLPQQVVMKDWPAESNYNNYGVEDSIRGIDRQLNADGSKMKSQLQPEKY